MNFEDLSNLRDLLADYVFINFVKKILESGLQLIYRLICSNIIYRSFSDEFVKLYKNILHISNFCLKLMNDFLPVV